jgi:hypothetical protein
VNKNATNLVKIGTGNIFLVSVVGMKTQESQLRRIMNHLICYFAT